MASAPPDSLHPSSEWSSCHSLADSDSQPVFVELFVEPAISDSAKAVAVVKEQDDGLSSAWSHNVSEYRSCFEVDYELSDRVMGTGSTGDVLEAVCRRTGRRVAVKSYTKESMSARQLQHMREEISIHASLAHPGIVGAEGVYESEAKVHLVMELLQGGELFEHVLEATRLSEAEAARIAVQVLLTLAYLHEHHISHRDIKLENLVFKSSGGQGLKLIDFGLACRFRANEKMRGRCGTLGYVAPEVMVGLRYDERVDVWSVGSVMYTLLTGSPVSDGDDDSDDEELQRRREVGAVKFNSCFQSLSKGAQQFVKGLLSESLARRPSAREALTHPWLLRMAPQEAAAALQSIGATDLERRRARQRWASNSCCLPINGIPWRGMFASLVGGQTGGRTRSQH